jgi:hypothetical protein
MTGGLRLTGAALTAALTLGIAGCRSEPPDVTEAPATAAPTTAALELACTPLDSAEAESLISNADTGVRNIPGAIVSAVSVLSNEYVPEDSPLNAGLQISYVALNVAGTHLLLAHPVDGLWAALDGPTEQATHFPQTGLKLGADPTSPAALKAVECVA